MVLVEDSASTPICCTTRARLGADQGGFASETTAQGINHWSPPAKTALSRSCMFPSRGTTGGLLEDALILVV